MFSFTTNLTPVCLVNKRLSIEFKDNLQIVFRKIILASSIGYEKIGCLYQEKKIYKEKQVEKKRHEMKWEMDRIGEG